VFSAQVSRAYDNRSYVLELLRYTPVLIFLSNCRKNLRDARDFQLPDDVPCDKRVEDLFRDVERCKVLHLEREDIAVKPKEGNEKANCLITCPPYSLSSRKKPKNGDWLGDSFLFIGKHSLKAVDRRTLSTTEYGV
jgi:hypothetical protein